MLNKIIMQISILKLKENSILNFNKNVNKKKL